MVEVPATKDMMQTLEENMINYIPQIRVWCHPHKVGRTGEDYFEIFLSFKDAFKFIKEHPKEAEEVPLIAFRGYELNLFEIKLLEEESLLNAIANKNQKKIDEFDDKVNRGETVRIL